MPPSVTAAYYSAFPSATTADVRASTAPTPTCGCQQLHDCIEIICTLILWQASEQQHKTHSVTTICHLLLCQAPDTASPLFLSYSELLVQLLLSVTVTQAAHKLLALLQANINCLHGCHCKATKTDSYPPPSPAPAPPQPLP
jgi:hypothetical protein